MRLAQLAILGALTVAAFVPTDGFAQGGWSGGGPVFQSDVEKRERELEARRSEIRKSNPVVYPKFMQGGEKPEIVPEAPPIAYLTQNEDPGSIIVDTEGRRLLYVLPGKRAYLYPISVGRDGFKWTGTERISRIASWPTWTPPPEMRQRQKGLPVTVTGGLINPLGAKALYLGSSIYRIHGTNNARTIGRASSSGCFRLMNKHVVHLATLAKIGTKVRVVAKYDGVSETAPMSSLFGFGNDDSPAAASPKKRKTASAKKKTVKQ